jgi:hypothetical protein
VKIFAYLADIDRLSTRANLFKKSCAPSSTCAACPVVETGRHLFFDCMLSSSIWAALGVTIPAGSFSIWKLPRPPAAAANVWQAGSVVLLWHIWKARNDLVFNNNNTSTPQVVLRRAADDLLVWRWRFAIGDREAVDSLRSLFLSVM